MHGTGGKLGRWTHEVPPEAQEAAREVAKVLNEAQRVLVLGHAGADGDVAGASLGLACALRKAGKDVVVYNELPYDKKYEFLAGATGVVTSLGAEERFDATVVVDAARPERCGRDFPDAERRGVFVWMDHHRIDVPPGDLNYIDLTAAAVGEQVVQVLDAMGIALDAETSTCVYTSLASDTGGFRYGNTSARAFALAARLVAAGVEPWSMTQALYENKPEPGVRLLGRALTSLERSVDGKVGTLVVSDDDLDATGATEEHVHGIVNHVRGIEGVELAILLRAQKDRVKAVIRSRGNVQAEPLAKAFGAKGHKNSASFEIQGAAVKDVHREIVRVASKVCDGREISRPVRVAPPPSPTPPSGTPLPARSAKK
jgi:phosphoesterase RecJ-like protein